MAIGDKMAYGIRIAAAEGSINKAVTAVWIAPEQGPINKAVTGIQIAPTQGPINKRVYIGGGILGDVSNDGRVSATDYTLVQLHIGGQRVLTQEEFHRGDVNQDGKLNQTDLDLLQAYITTHG